VPAGHASDLTDDAVVGVVLQELELCAFLGPASLFDYSLVSRGQSVPGGECVTSARREAEVIQTTVKVEDALPCELLPEHYRFGKVQLDDRQNLNNRRFAEQIGRQLWPFLEPSGVQTCPSDFVARHLIAAPSCVTVWNRRGMVVACATAGRAEADLLEARLGEVAAVARELRLFQTEVRALLTGDPDAETGGMQARSHALLQRVIDLQLAAAMPENGILRRFYDATRFDGVLGMLRELSAAVLRHAEAQRAKLQTRLLTILGAMFSLLSAWSAVAALANVKLEDFSFRSWSDWQQHPALIIALGLVSLGVLVTLSIAFIVPAKMRIERERRPPADLPRKDLGP
jgi:hypothetical protein